MESKEITVGRVRIIASLQKDGRRIFASVSYSDTESGRVIWDTQDWESGDPEADLNSAFSHGQSRAAEFEAKFSAPVKKSRRLSRHNLPYYD